MLAEDFTIVNSAFLFFSSGSTMLSGYPLN